MTVSTSFETGGELFFAELVAGPAALADHQVATLQTYFGDVAATRKFPLHPAVLWNALYWGFDLCTGRYSNAPVDDFVTVTTDKQVQALPIGAFIRVPTGGNDEFWGEIVYKEGRHPDLQPDWVPPMVSGAPVELSADKNGRRVAVVHEALIADFDAVEPAAERNLERQGQRGRVIDSRHHLVVDAVYSPDDAELDDATYFARWMLRHHHDELVTGRFGAGLEPEVLEDDDLLLSAMVSSIATVEYIAASTPSCTSWRNYIFDTDAYRRRIAAHNVPLAGADFEHLAHSLTLVPRGSTVAYVALGLRVAADHGDDAELQGPRWASMVCHLSRYIVDTLAETAPDGVSDTRAGPVHLRLDDAWQAGGVWRTQLLMGGWDPICAVAPDIPIGLGYAEAAGVRLPWGPQIPADEDELDLLEVSASELGATVVLSKTDIEMGRLRLPAELLQELRRALVVHHADAPIVRLAVEGFALDAAERTHHPTIADDPAARSPLIGIDWPWPFVVGARITVRWTRGAAVLDIALARRPEPLIVADFEYAFDCDEKMFARSIGALPRPAASHGRTLRDLVLEAFRSRGEELGDGSRRATLRRIVLAVYGPNAAEAAARSVWLVAEALCADGTLRTDDDHYIWTPAIGRRTRVVDRSLLEEYGAETLARYVRQPYAVGLFLRRLPVSEEASEERQSAYRRAWEEAGRPPWLPSRLPHGKTFVVAHIRGARRLDDRS